MGIAVALGVVRNMCVEVRYFRGNCGLVGCGDGGLGPRFRGDDEGATGAGAGITEGCAGVDGGRRGEMAGRPGVFAGLVGCGDGGLGPRFRGDDEEATGAGAGTTGG